MIDSVKAARPWAHPEAEPKGDVASGVDDPESPGQTHCLAMGAMARRVPWVELWAVLAGLLLALLAIRSPSHALLALIAVGAILIVITRPSVVLLAMAAAFPWENKLHYPTASLSIVKGIGALLVLAYLLRLVRSRGARILLPPLLGIVARLAAWVALSLVASTDPAQGVQKLTRWFMFLTFFFLTVQMIDSRRDVERLLRRFVASVSAAALYSLVLFVGAHNGYRAAGPLEDPNDFGYLLACAAPLPLT